MFRSLFEALRVILGDSNFFIAWVLNTTNGGQGLVFELATLCIILFGWGLILHHLFIRSFKRTKNMTFTQYAAQPVILMKAALYMYIIAALFNSPIIPEAIQLPIIQDAAMRDYTYMGVKPFFESFGGSDSFFYRLVLGAALILFFWFSFWAIFYGIMHFMAGGGEEFQIGDSLTSHRVKFQRHLGASAAIYLIFFTVVPWHLLIQHIYNPYQDGIIPTRGNGIQATSSISSGSIKAP